MHTELETCVKIETELVKWEMGERLESLQQFVQFVYGEDSTLSDFRYAPSLVCRSEIALLGFSSPRFALRAYPLIKSKTCAGFVNLRRVARLASQKAHCLDSAGNSRLVQFGDEMLQQPSFIADSILAVPSRFTGTHHVIATDCSSEYAEPGLPGVPFMQSLRWGGGLCAQACAWMATAHLLSFAATLHGPSEISLIAANRQSVDPPSDGPFQISINGLSFMELSKYFDSVSLAGPLCVFEASDDRQRKLAEHFLRSHISSGIPVIIAVDLGRLCGSAGTTSEVRGKSIYGELASSAKAFMPRVRHMVQHHAVLAFGINKTTSECLIADPASVPFLGVTVEDLIKRRTYGDKSPNENDQITGDRLIDDNLSRHFRCQPVLPDRVKCRLGLSIVYTENSYEKHLGLDSLYGLIGRDVWIKWGVPNEVVDLMATIGFEQTECRLVNAGVSSKTVSAFLSAAPQSLLDAIAQRGDHWFWIQRIPVASESAPLASVWIAWDAEGAIGVSLDAASMSNAVDSELVAKDLIVFAQYEVTGQPNVKEFVTFAKPTVAAAPSRPVKASLGKLGISTRVLSSCFPAATIEGLRMLRDRLVNNGRLDEKQVLPVELYMAMASDCRELFTSYSDATNVTEVLAAAQGSPALAKWAGALAQKLHDNMLQVEGFATFIPEIVSADKSIRDSGVGALAAIQEMAAIFLSHSHPVKFIEFVGGSVFNGIQTSETPGVNLGAALRDTMVLVEQRSKMIRRIADCLESVVDRLSLDGKGDGVTPFLAELEPGPGFVLNTLETLQTLQKLTSPKVPLKLNYDVPHFRIARENDRVRAIFKTEGPSALNLGNVHMAGHSKAHIGDCLLTDIEQEDVDLLNYITQNMAVGVSLEFEAAPSVEAVETSFLTLFK